MQLIYSSIDDAKIVWSSEDLNAVKQHKEVFKRNKEYDVLGLYYEYNGRDFYTLISAEDKYGNRKLDYLKFLLLGAFIIGTTLAWMLSFYLSKKALRPLEKLRRQMQEITSKNLVIRVPEPERQDEIKALSQSFNQMLDRIDKAYKSQKSFTSNASHELRTPIARIAMQLENLMKGKELDDNVKATLLCVLEDTYQLSDIISSLLLLSKIEDTVGGTAFQKIRLDEVVFKMASRISKMHPDFKLQFEIEKNNNTMVNQLKDLSVISSSQAESIRRSLETIGSKDLYIQDLQHAMARKDSLNMAMVMNLKSALKDINDQDIEIKVEKSAVFISISDKLLFKSGSHEVSDRAQVVLGKVAQVLNSKPEIEFLVEGHTDNVPIRGNAIQDNWDLSTKRATSVVRILQNRYGIDPKRMTAGGRSEYMPVLSNDTVSGKAANRRTRIIILPQLDQFFKLLEKA
jgi:chemotaxis protein MotB